MSPRRHAPGCPPDCDVCLDDYYADEEAADQVDELMAEARCPNCFEPVDDHWRMDMTPLELRAWHNNQKVCIKKRSEVVDMVLGL